jgi:ribonuclease BN (tRNA processing enzyme)
MSDLTLQFLGSGDLFGSGGRFQTCFYVDSAHLKFLIDCGASALTAMRQFGVDPAQIDLIVLSHLHGDHFAGLPYFILEAHLISKRQRPLLIAGPPHTKERLFHALEVLFPGAGQLPLRFHLEVLEITPAATCHIGPVSITPFEVVHFSGAPAYALRIACQGKVITYSGDTEWHDNLIEAAQGADLFICEAYFYEKKVKYHLDYRTLLAHRPELACRRLILTHMNEDLLRRRDQVELEWAEDGKKIIV